MYQTRRPRTVSVFRIGIVIAAIVAANLAGSFSPPISRAAAPAGSRLPWQGNDWYLSGVNVPWFTWSCDFGCGAEKGVSDPAVQAQLQPAFRQAQASGIHVLRWWMFEGGAWQITRDGSGAPLEINPTVYADIDAALRLAETYDLYLVFTLFGPLDLPRAWLDQEPLRLQLASVLGQMFARYRTNPRVLAWDIFNEPEWQIWDGSVERASVQATVRAVADAIHANSPAYATVASAMLDGLPLWVGQGLDFYTANWYDYMAGGDWCALCTDYAEVRARYNLDAPLMIGEFYAASDIDARARLRSWYNKGYAGALAWSLFPDRTNDKQAVDLTAFADFSQTARDLGPRGNGN